MKWNFLMYIKVLNKHICFTAEKGNLLLFHSRVSEAEGVHN